jgi:hypothetical protein
MLLAGVGVTLTVPSTRYVRRSSSHTCVHCTALHCIIDSPDCDCLPVGIYLLRRPLLERPEVGHQRCQLHDASVRARRCGKRWRRGCRYDGTAETVIFVLHLPRLTLFGPFRPKQARPRARIRCRSLAAPPSASVVVLHRGYP